MTGNRWGALAGPLVLAALILAGVTLAIWQPVGLAQLLAWGERLTAHPLMLLVLIAAMALLFTFGFPGSVFLWLVAPFQPPLAATAVLLAGSVTGALGAYLLAKRLGSTRPLGRRGRQVVDFLSARSDLATQCALRLLPGFPHSAVNYAGGILRLPLRGFLLAALMGLGIKWAVYASAVHSGVGALERGEVIDFRDVLPLVILAVLLLLGAWARRMIERRRP